MYISQIQLKNFKCFGPRAQKITLQPDLTFFIGNNGSGKSSVFLALSKIFGATKEERTIKKEDFYVGINEKIDNVKNREMYIDITFDFPEITNTNQLPETLAAFEHYIFANDKKIFQARIRLEAKWSPTEYDDDVDTSVYWVNTDKDIPFGENYEFKSSIISQDRKLIELRYIPAFRHSNAILRNNISKLVKLITDYAELEDEKGKNDKTKTKSEEIDEFNKELQDEIKDIEALKNIKNIIDKNWNSTHDNYLKCYSKTQFDVTPSNLNDLLRSISLKLVPNEHGNPVDIDNLSDGQLSLLYITLSLTLFEIEQKHYRNEIQGLKQYDKIPSILTIFALEEPENHLSPFYLTKIFDLFENIKHNQYNMVGLFSTHSPAVIKRAKNIKQIRYFMQYNGKKYRFSSVKEILLPTSLKDDDYKYLNQAILKNTEIYFSKLVVLGEGDSEEIIIPNIAKKIDINLDSNFVSFTKLGGRHVNYMWKLLENLKIPYITLLDFDLGRYGGGLHRILYAINQLEAYGKAIELPQGISIDDIKNGNITKEQLIDLFKILENSNIYFSTPLDLDMYMIRNYPQIYSEENNENNREKLLSSVLKKNGNYAQYEKFEIELKDEELKRYKEYFCKKSKVSSHYIAIEKILEIPNETFKKTAPKNLCRFITKANNLIKGDK
ncbi:MAG: AAA family ATPase [Alphaproteobacteria bacterium]|nr:AAA family ATPase [Alphaproteobacteria bacterium]